MPVGGAIDGDYQTTSLSYIDTVNLTTSLTTGNSWVYLLLTRWSDDEPDRNIERAVRETSLVAPLEAKASLTCHGKRLLAGSGATLSFEYAEGTCRC